MPTSSEYAEQVGLREIIKEACVKMCAEQPKDIYGGFVDYFTDLRREEIKDKQKPNAKAAPEPVKPTPPPRPEEEKTEGGLDNIKVWTGFIKLDGKMPMKDAIQHLLYNSDKGSAEDCDVIALFLTDLCLNDKYLNQAKSLANRSLLRNAVRDEDSYIFNEDDDALLIKHIPAQLVQVVEGSGNKMSRYNSLHIAVHRRNVIDHDGNDDVNHHDCFPMPVGLSCRTNRKNDTEAAFKSILNQEVLLQRGGDCLQLLLLGANLDTHNSAKQSQLEQLERMINHLTHFKAKEFCAIIWGDFNNRLHCYDELEADLKKSNKGKFELSDTNIDHLTKLISSPEGRRELLSKDALVYTGLGLGGCECGPAPCDIKLRDLFHLSVDAMHPESKVDIPLPSYKQIPYDAVISKQTNHPLILKELEIANEDTKQGTPEQIIRDRYFSWEEHGKFPQRKVRSDDGNNYLQLGWLDGIGVYKKHTCNDANLTVWETEADVQAFDHLPLRGIVEINY